MLLGPPIRGLLAVLQWGRALMSAEIQSGLSVSSALRNASMGPRSDERGNGVLRNTERAPAGLQWGRALMSAEIIRRPRGAERRRTLQWGRALMSAEIMMLRGQSRFVRDASMGPRSDERGNLFPLSQVELDVCVLQWGRALMSAEMASPPRPTRPSPTGFNGAAL